MNEEYFEDDFEEVDEWDYVHTAIGKAWEEFFKSLDQAGIDADRAGRYMDAKDCFGDVADCIYQAGRKA